MTAPVAPAAFYLGPPERALFGWFHAPTAPSRGAAIVLCNPIGDDYVRAHRTLRHLAERLAAIGFAVLRFDFHGTGDSTGSERDAGRVAAWQQDVGLAVAEARRRSGCTTVGVVGLRLGATIAALAGVAVESLVLWSPYTSGGAFVTESTQMHQMLKLLEPQSFSAQPPDWHSGGQEALGFLLTPDTVADLKRVDLLALDHPAAPHTLLIGASKLPSADDKLLAHLRTLGEVDYRHLPGHKFLTQINHHSDLPEPIMAAIADWLSARHPALASAAAPPPISAAVTFDDEQPVVFGRAHRLFGILARPPAPLRVSRRPAIVMTNAGCVHRIGPHRSYVALARRWAARGYWVFRVDLSGIGDSPAAPGGPENVTYPPHALADLEDAMAAVTARTAIDRFIVLGLCSGGDLAFQTGFKDPRVSGVVLINPRTFCINDLEMVESYKRARYYQSSFLRLESWKKALRGEVDLRRAMSMVVPKVKDLVKSRLARWWPEPRMATPAQQNDVPACLRMMAERGVDTLIVVSEKDPGIDYVDEQFGARMQALRSVPGYRREDFRGTDHTFTSLYSQEQVSQLLTDHFVARHPG